MGKVKYIVAVDAGHGLFTAGKRTPDDEREWTFNDKAVDALTVALSKHPDIKVVRVDDPTGQADVPLATRVNRAIATKADIYISYHHNALLSKWGTHGGTETFTARGSQPKSEKLAKLVHAEVVKAYGLRDRGLKKEDYYVLKATIGIPAILIEGGFMDSTVDIKKLRDNKVLKAAGQGVAKAVLKYFGLKDSVSKEPQKPVSKPSTPVKNEGGEKLIKVKVDSLYTYKTANWADKGKTVDKGDVFTVKKELTVDGYKMYQLKSGLYITASSKYVTVL